MADPATLLKHAAALYKKGDRVKAREILLKLIELDENNEKAWLLLSAAVDGLEDKQIALENVLTINPKNEKARKGLDLVNKKLAQMTPKPKDEPLGGSGWSQIDTEAEVETPEDGWSTYLDDSQAQSPFVTTRPDPATPAAPAETSNWDDDESGWGDLDASAVFTQANEDSGWGDTSATSTPPPDEPVASNWGDIDTEADPWGATESSVELSPEASPWGEATPATSAPTPVTDDPWSDTHFSFNDDSDSPWGGATPATSAPVPVTDDPWSDTDFSFDDDSASPWSEATPALPIQSTTPVPPPTSSSAKQPSGADYDEWIGELNLKSDASSTASAWGNDSSPWGDPALTTSDPEEASPWAQDAAAVSDAWSDWGTGETPVASAFTEEPRSSSTALPFTMGTENPFGEMPIDDMASSTSLGMDENPFDSPIDVNASVAFTKTAPRQSSGGALNFGSSGSPFDDLLDEDEDDDDADFDLYDDEEAVPLSDSISETAGYGKRLAKASSGTGQSSSGQYFRMIPNEIQIPPKRASQLGVLLTVLVLALLNIGALGLLVSQLLG